MAGRIGRLLTRFLFFAHWVACLWWIIGAWPGEEEMKKPIAEADSGQLTYWPLRPKRGGIRIDWNTTLSQQYFSSYYWALSTLMKTAWIPPGTVGEKVYTAIMVFLGAIIFAFIVGNVTAVVKAFDAANSKRRDKIAAMRRFAETRKLGTKLTSQVLAYVDAEWTWTDGISTISFLKNTAELPTSMRNDLLRAFYTDIVHGANLFKGLCRDCVRMLLEELTPQAVVKKATLIQGGRLCMDVFILMKGTLQLTMTEQPEPVRKASMNAGDRASSERGTDGSDASPARSLTRQKTKGKMGGGFRMIERQGSAIGFMTPYDTPWKAPFTVTAAKISFLYGIRGSAMREILSHFEGRDDKEKLLTNLKNEYTQCAGKDGTAAQEARLEEKQAEAAAAAPVKKGPDIYEQLKADETTSGSISGMMQNTADETKKSQKQLTIAKEQLASMPLLLKTVKHLLDPANNEKPNYEELTTAYDTAIGADENYAETASFSPRALITVSKKSNAYENSKKAMGEGGKEDMYDPSRVSIGELHTKTQQDSTVAGAVMG